MLTPGQAAPHPGRPQTKCDKSEQSLLANEPESANERSRFGASERASERRIIHRLWPFPAAVVTFPLGWNAPSPGRATSSVLLAVAARLIKELLAGTSS